MFGIAGSVLLFTSHAATPTVSLEAESGSISSAASSISDSTASGALAVKFGTSGTITNGEQINASNTGLTGDGVSASSLTPVSGSVTYGSSFNGQTISMKSYTGTVTISGSNITLKDCKIVVSGMNTFAIDITGSNNKVQNCLITSTSGTSYYEGIAIESGTSGNIATRNEISFAENLITTYGTNVTINYNYLHDASHLSNPSAHPDAIEIYGGGPTLIQYNRIVEVDLGDAPINAAPYGPYTLTGLSVFDNFLDNGQSIFIIDNQSSAVPGNAGIQNTRVERNVFGGHTNPDTVNSYGIYAALANNDGRAIAQDEATLTANPNDILWPTSGANANHWGECTGLTPDATGQIAYPRTYL